MNLSRLLRTALFSVLALVFAGGMMAAQAQDAEVEFDPVEFNTLEDALEQLDDDVGAAGGTTGLLAIPEDDYQSNAGTGSNTGTIRLANPDGADIDNIEELTIEVRSGGGNAAVLGGISYDPDVATSDVLENVTVQSAGGQFVRLTEVNANAALELGGTGHVSGTFDISESGVVEVDGGSTIERFAGVSLTGNDIVYRDQSANPPTLAYSTDSGTPISTGPEVIDAIGTLDVDNSLGGADGDGEVTFSSDLTANSVAFGNTGNTVNFDGDFTVATGAFTVANSSQTIDVAGELTFSQAFDAIGSAVTVDGTLEANDFKAFLEGGDQTIVDGGGTLTVTNEFSVLPNSDGIGNDREGEVNVGASSSEEDFDLGTVVVGSDAQDDPNETFVSITTTSNFDSDGELTADGDIDDIDIAADAAGTVTLDAATDITGNSVSSGNSIDTGGGTLEIGTSSASATVTDESEETINNDSGSIEIYPDSELKIDADAGVTVNNGGGINIAETGQFTLDDDQDATVDNDGGISGLSGSGTGTASFTGSGDHEVTSGTDNDLPNVDTDASGLKLSLDNNSNEISAADVVAEDDLTFNLNADAPLLNTDLTKLTVKGGETNFETNTGSNAATLSVTDFRIEGNGTIDLTGGGDNPNVNAVTLEVSGNLTRRDGPDIDIQTSSASTIDFTGSNDGEFSIGGTRYVFTGGTIKINKDNSESPTVTIVDNRLELNDASLELVTPSNSITDATLELDGFNLIAEGDGGSSIDVTSAGNAGNIDIDTGGNSVVFREGGNTANTITSDGTTELEITQVQNQSSSSDLDIGNGSNALTLTVSSLIWARNGGFDIEDNGAILNPGEGAEVRRTLDGSISFEKISGTPQAARSTTPETPTT